MNCQEVMEILDRNEIEDIDDLKNRIDINYEIEDNEDSDTVIALCHKIQVIKELFFSECRTNKDFAEEVHGKLKEHILQQANNKINDKDLKKLGVKSIDSIIQLVKKETEKAEKKSACTRVSNEREKYNEHIKNHKHFLENFCEVYQFPIRYFEKKDFFSKKEFENYLKKNNIQLGVETFIATSHFDQYLKMLEYKTVQYIENALFYFIFDEIEQENALELMIYAFDRDIDSNKLLDYCIKANEKYETLSKDCKFVYTKAKVFSNLGRDQDAIETLLTLKESDDQEMNNLLGASFKRKALSIYKITKNELLDYVVDQLKISLYYYERACEKAEDKEKYYPLINIFNLELVLAKLQNVSNHELASCRLRNKSRMKNFINKNSNDTWEQLTYLEYLIYRGEFQKGLNYFYNLNTENINNFQLRSFTRQLSLHLPFTSNEDQIQILDLMDKLKK